MRERAEISIGIDEERASRLISDIDRRLGARCAATMCAELDKAAGRLQFAASWAAGRFGKAALQPLHAGSHRTRGGSKRPPSDAERAAIRAALEFFLSILLSAVSIPRKRLAFGRRSTKPTVRVWTDASFEPELTNPGRLGFVVEFPAEGAPGDGDYCPAKWVHGSYIVPEWLMALFLQRKQYIGQLELLAAVGVYRSVPELRGRRIVHYIDNTSALCGLIKGYSRAADSARVVHAFHSFNLGLGAEAWFQYMASKGNIADLPSRGEFELLHELGSVEVDFVVPSFQEWSEPAGAWLERASSGRRTIGTVAVGNVADGRTPRDVIAFRQRNNPLSAPLANPFVKRDERERAAVCEACERVMRDPLRSDVATIAEELGLSTAPGYEADELRRARQTAIAALVERVAGGGNVRLLCACYPRRCHCDFIAKHVCAKARALVARRVSRSAAATSGEG